MENENRKWRILGIKNRYWVLLFIVLGFLGARAYPPVLPQIQLPAERYSEIPLFTLPIIGDFYWTNTLTAMVITDVILLLIAIIVYRASKSQELVPKGFSGAIEALIEVMHNLTETTAGKWTRTIFPFFATITMLVLVANWMELIPGVDSIGILHTVHDPLEKSYPIEQVVGNIFTLVRPEDGVGQVSEGEQHGGLFILTPYVRVLSTDLNFTVALALISVFMTQVIGFRSLGWSYFEKFINVKGIFTRPIFGIIDFGVGLLELISELSKILSFSFRLFGNIFAGSVLLFVIGTLVPVLAQSLFLMLEFFVGIIQALVFGMLTMVFMAQATAGHGTQEE